MMTKAADGSLSLTKLRYLFIVLYYVDLFLFIDGANLQDICISLDQIYVHLRFWRLIFGRFQKWWMSPSIAIYNFWYRHLESLQALRSIDKKPQTGTLPFSVMP